VENQQGGPPARQISPGAQLGRPKEGNELSKEKVWNRQASAKSAPLAYPIPSAVSGL